MSPPRMTSQPKMSRYFLKLFPSAATFLGTTPDNLVTDSGRDGLNLRNGSASQVLFYLFIYLLIYLFIYFLGGYMKCKVY